MSKLIRVLLLAAAIVVPLVAVGVASADDYWTNHWNWYDNTYRPYYYRNYSYAPGYNTYAPGYYGSPYGGYYGNAYSPYGYNYGYGYATPYRNYVGTPGFGFGQTYGGGSALNIVEDDLVGGDRL